MENTFTPEPKPSPFSKRQSIDCPRCGLELKVKQQMQCMCGAVFELQIKEVCGPEGYEQ